MWKKGKIQIIVFLLFSIVVLTISRRKILFAKQDFFVAKIKENAHFYLGKEIKKEQFMYYLQEMELQNLEQISLYPTSFEKTGEQLLQVVYQSEKEVYMSELVIHVEEKRLEKIDTENMKLHFVENQEITRESLPKVYALYNDGEKIEVKDYDYKMDWAKEKIYFYWRDKECSLPVEVVPNALQFIEVEPVIQEIQEIGSLKTSDLKVFANYTNGKKEQVEEFCIVSCFFTEKGTVRVSVWYEGIIGSCEIQAQKVVEQPENSEKADKGESKNEGIKPTEKPICTPLPNREDHISPSINIKEKTYQKGVKIYAKDTESGVASIRLEGPIKGIIKNGSRIDKEGSYVVIVTDNAGNKKRVKFKIQKRAKSLKVEQFFVRNWKKIRFKGKVSGTKRQVTWHVDQKKVGTITAKGIFTGKQDGICYVTAKIDHLKVKKKVVVNMRNHCILVY